MISEIGRGSEKVIFFLQTSSSPPLVCHLLASVEAMEPGPVVFVKHI